MNIIKLFIFYLPLIFKGCPSYEPLSFDASQNLYPIKDGHKWGYIDETGVIIVPPQYDSTLHYHRNNYLVLDEHKNWKVLDSNFNVSIQNFQPPLDTTLDFSLYWNEIENCFNLKPVVLYENTTQPITKYLDKKGKERFRVEGVGSPFCDEGYARILYKTPLEHGFISKSQNYVIDTLGNKVFEILKNGDIKVFENQCTIWLTYSSSMHGLLDKSGAIILPDIYQSIKVIDANFAIVLNYGDSKVFNQPNDKFALFDIKNKQFITKFEFDDLDTKGFRPNLIRGKVNGKMVYINREGVTVWKEM